MKARIAVAGLLCLATALYGRSVWDGVFTQAQADRGEEQFAEECASCHSDDLGGNGFAPPLAGPEFREKWKKESVGRLFERLRTTMPDYNPGGLSLPAYVDITAFILSANKFPAGSTPLEDDIPTLNTIRFEMAGK
jgi:mono/diheme cytochrome c family protein